MDFLFLDASVFSRFNLKSWTSFLLLRVDYRSRLQVARKAGSSHGQDLFLPGGYVPRLESKERECWKFLDWQLNSENDSRLHGQPSHPLPSRPCPRL